MVTQCFFFLQGELISTRNVNELVFILTSANESESGNLVYRCTDIPIHRYTVHCPVYIITSINCISSEKKDTFVVLFHVKIER